MKSRRGKIRNYDPVICEKFVCCSVDYIWAFHDNLQIGLHCTSECFRDFYPELVNVLWDANTPTISTSHTHINPWAGLCLALPSLCLLLFICCGFSLIWQLSWFPLRFLRDGRCGLFLFLFREAGAVARGSNSGLGRGVCDTGGGDVAPHLITFRSTRTVPEPGPGQRSCLSDPQTNPTGTPSASWRLGDPVVK